MKRSQSDQLADLSARCGQLEMALFDLLDWRGAVNQHADFLLSGTEGDAAAKAVALFNGPVWDAAERAMKP